MYLSPREIAGGKKQIKEVYEIEVSNNIKEIRRTGLFNIEFKEKKVDNTDLNISGTWDLVITFLDNKNNLEVIQEKRQFNLVIPLIFFAEKKERKHNRSFLNIRSKKNSIQFIDVYWVSEPEIEVTEKDQGFRIKIVVSGEIEGKLFIQEGKKISVQNRKFQNPGRNFNFSKKTTKSKFSWHKKYHTSKKNKKKKKKKEVEVKHENRYFGQGLEE